MMKRTLICLLTVFCLAVVFAGCSAGRSDNSTTATNAPTEAVQTQASQAANDWLELGEEGILTVRIPLDGREGYFWTPSIAEGSPLELLTDETTDTEYVASFRAIGNGEASLSLSYASNTHLVEARSAELICMDGKVREIATCNVMEMDLPLEPSENQPDTTPVVIAPLPLSVDIANLGDCTVAASLEEGDFYLDDDGKAQMKFTIYDYDRYDMVDIANLAVGDRIEIRGEEIEVRELERPDGSMVSINGGKELGGFDLTTDDSGVFFEMGENDVKSWLALGTVTLPVNPEFVFEDSSDLDSGLKTWYAGDFLMPQVEIAFGFSALNTTVTIQNGEVIAMYRVYIP